MTTRDTFSPLRVECIHTVGLWLTFIVKRPVHQEFAFAICHSVRLYVCMYVCLSCLSVCLFVCHQAT